MGRFRGPSLSGRSRGWRSAAVDGRHGWGRCCIGTAGKTRSRAFDARSGPSLKLGFPRNCVAPNTHVGFENRLASVTPPADGTVTFQYEPFGRRIQKSSPAGTTNYVY